MRDPCRLSATQGSGFQLGEFRSAVLGGERGRGRERLG
jgi:hypothetical protein